MWPPNLPKEKEEELKHLAIDWCSTNGLIVRNQSSFIHVPFSLFPSPFPRNCFDFAKDIQPIFNTLVDKVASDSDFINRVISDLSKHDQFTSSLYEVYQITSQQNITLGIHRSDYLLHGDESIKQVELNTVASSFSSLSGLTTDLHQFLSTSIVD
jgi:hypothetical protein